MRKNNKYEVELKMSWLEMIGGVALFLFIFIIVPGIAGHIENHYTRKDCVVTEITEDYVVAVDKFDDEWSWYIDGTDLEIGDSVDLKIFNGCTDNRLDDDEVVKIK